MIIFGRLAQNIADYLNMDGKLERQKTLFCLLNVTSSGGLVGLFFLVILSIYGNVNYGTVMVVLLAVAVIGWFDALRAFRQVERRRVPVKHANYFLALYIAPIVLYLFVAEILMIVGV
ncbi:MAG: hypothetical protein LUC48_03660 [Clostridiales bacterium]|nr:hypothetical protein [Clostridiales bacterium]